MKKDLPFIFVLVLILSVFSYFLYNIDKTSNEIDYFIKYNYSQEENIKEEIEQKINEGLIGLIKEEVSSNELSSVISFEKSADRADFFINLFSFFSVLFLALIGYLVIDNRKAQEKYWLLIQEMEEKRDDFVKKIDNANVILKEGEKILSNIKKEKKVVDRIKFRHTTKRLKERLKTGKFVVNK